MMSLHWEVLFEPPYLSVFLEGMRLTVELALLSGLASFVLGALLACGRCSRVPSAAAFCAAFCSLLRSLPGIFWLLLLFFCLPVLLPEEQGRALNGWDGFPFWAAAGGLTLNNTPFMADILFASLQSENRNTLDAARLSGLGFADCWLRIALPAAVSTSMPALSVRILHDYRNTSLAMVISVPELTWASQEVESLSFAGFECACAATVCYCVLGLLFSGGLKLVSLCLARSLHRQTLR